MSIFTKIINGEIPAFKVYENETTLAFLDIKPNVDGHTLVISKKEYEDIFDIPDDVLADLIKTVKKVSKIIKEKLQCDGLNIYTNVGEAAGQEVKHLHFHIVPRYNNDGIYATEGFHKAKDRNVKKSLEEIYKQLTD